MRSEGVGLVHQLFHRATWDRCNVSVIIFTKFPLQASDLTGPYCSKMQSRWLSGNLNNRC
jgi:hypothetical protein